MEKPSKIKGWRKGCGTLGLSSKSQQRSKCYFLSCLGTAPGGTPGSFSGYSLLIVTLKLFASQPDSLEGKVLPWRKDKNACQSTMPQSKPGSPTLQSLLEFHPKKPGHRTRGVTLCAVWGDEEPPLQNCPNQYLLERGNGRCHNTWNITLLRKAKYELSKAFLLHV